MPNELYKVTLLSGKKTKIYYTDTDAVVMDGNKCTNILFVNNGYITVFGKPDKTYKIVDCDRVILSPVEAFIIRRSDAFLSNKNSSLRKSSLEPLGTKIYTEVKC